MHFPVLPAFPIEEPPPRHGTNVPLFLILLGSRPVAGLKQYSLSASPALERAYLSLWVFIFDLAHLPKAITTEFSLCT